MKVFSSIKAFLLSHVLQVIHGVADGHPFKVVDLAAAENRRQDLMLLGGGEDEDDVCGWFFQCLQKGVEGRGGEHVHLVDDKHLVFAKLWWDAGLLHQRLDVLYGVVAGCVEFEDVE